MDIAGRIGQDLAEELFVNSGQAGGRIRNGRAKVLADSLGDRLPHRAVADMLHVVEGIVKHPVRLSAERGPIGGIEGVGRHPIHIFP
jgi:hypothetical protein